MVLRVQVVTVYQEKNRGAARPHSALETMAEFHGVQAGEISSQQHQRGTQRQNAGKGVAAIGGDDYTESFAFQKGRKRVRRFRIGVRNYRDGFAAHMCRKLLS